MWPGGAGRVTGADTGSSGGGWPRILAFAHPQPSVVLAPPCPPLSLLSLDPPHPPRPPCRGGVSFRPHLRLRLAFNSMPPSMPVALLSGRGWGAAQFTRPWRRRALGEMSRAGAGREGAATNGEDRGRGGPREMGRDGARDGGVSTVRGVRASRRHGRSQGQTCGLGARARPTQRARASPRESGGSRAWLPPGPLARSPSQDRGQWPMPGPLYCESCLRRRRGSRRRNSQ